MNVPGPASAILRIDGIALGDWWTDSVAGTVCRDDIGAASFAQDFEHGLGTFTAAKGTATLTMSIDGQALTTAAGVSAPTAVLSLSLSLARIGLSQNQNHLCFA